MHAIAVLFVLLAFPTQAVFCFFKNVNFSTPEQCGPFEVNFSKPTEPPALPLSLTIVPISSYPISVVLPSDSWDNNSDAGSARITFLPLESGTKFVASLDDATGNSVGFISDIIAVANSSVTTCLPPKQGRSNFYGVHGSLSQCSRFNVTFNPSMISHFPTIRAFLPRYFSFPVNATSTPVNTFTPDFRGDHGNGKRDGDDSSDDHDNKSNSTNNSGGGASGNSGNNGKDDSDNKPHNISSKEYVLDVMHGFQAVLSFDDGEGHRETSGLFTAGGTSGSSSNCFKETFSSPSRSAESGSPQRSSNDEHLSKQGKIIVSVLGVSVAISIAIIIYILVRKRRRVKRDLEKTSFVFTEDVDMGSSFMSSLATRIRTRISQMTSGKRSFRSYRSYRDERDGASTWIPTSPIGSVAPLSPKHTSLMQTEKTLSWIAFDKDAQGYPDDGMRTLARNSRDPENSESNALYTLPNVEITSPMPLFPTPARLRWSKPDVPKPAVSRSSESSRFLLGSGYLSNRSSGPAPILRNGGSRVSKELPKQPDASSASAVRSSESSRFVLGSGYLSSSSSGPPRMTQTGKTVRPNKRQSAPPRHSNINEGRSSGAVLSTDFSSSGYMPSRSSSATPEPESNGIYISSPIQPTSDLPLDVPSQQRMESGAEAGKMESTPATMVHDPDRPLSRYFSLRREGSQNRGRILPFPTVSLRASRTSSQQ
ncbi:uncharacterized protein FOMMEDRAFT_149398 [Fomitiporia mediterranea MF3/22]|uniref:uncharacterized protein n=1 Tax=Fomitiporia mediterranea (strain MF3/22) TaxID=694068 RepID=UPI000440940B|nr:uncharacterized protein FOMMEDRAFT_149398 [Fomitiporia mediterranea MF3/22]EJC97926.1 hypothetical protein FOMMEDRAFT_149398 [Fomitiporia mediterranea MF3/22]